MSDTPLQRAIARLKNDADMCEFVTTAVHFYGDDKDQLGKDIRLVLAELEAAQADSKRMDWLEKAKSAEYVEGPCCWRINMDARTDHETLRESIDAARAIRPQPKPFQDEGEPGPGIP